MRFILSLFIMLSTIDLGFSADKFGQDPNILLEKQVDLAKSLRLPYSREFDPSKSIAILKDVISKKNDYYRAYFNLGLAYAEIGEVEESRGAFERALVIRKEFNIKDITLLNSYGWTRLNIGDYDNAERLFKSAIDDKAFGSDYTNSAIYNNLGLLYFYTQRFEEAKNYLKIAVDSYSSESAGNTLDIISKIQSR